MNDLNVTDRIALHEPPTPYKHSKVITVRMPAELHKRLTVEARKCQTSMNIYCVSAIECALEETTSAHTVPASACSECNELPAASIPVGKLS